MGLWRIRQLLVQLGSTQYLKAKLTIATISRQTWRHLFTKYDSVYVDYSIVSSALVPKITARWLIPAGGIYDDVHDTRDAILNMKATHASIMKEKGI